MFTAGQIAIDPATGQVVPGDIKAQTERICENLKAILEAAGTDLESVVRARCSCARWRILRDERGLRAVLQG